MNTKNENSKDSIFMWLIITCSVLAVIIGSWYSIKIADEKDRTINNLQAQIVSLQEENRDVMNLNAELMEEIEELKNEGN